MPRRKANQDDPFLEPVLALPPAHRKHDHEIDAYEAPPGAVPITVKPSKSSTSRKPLEREMTKGEIEARKEAKLAQRALEQRYMMYLDELSANGGNTEQALALVFSVSIEEARARRLELQIDVRRGLASSSLADELEKNDLSLKARVGLLRKHAFSLTPAASLKAIDMIADMEGDRGSEGNFEMYLRLAKEQSKR